MSDSGAAGDATVTVGIPIACWDGSVEAGSSVWGRNDIAYCRHPTGLMLSVSEAVTACGLGWHVCSGQEFVDRNDAAAGSPNFRAVMDAGGDCAINISSSGCWDLSSDYAVGSGGGPNPSTHCPNAAGYSNSCSPLVSIIEYSVTGRCTGSPGIPGNCGVLCCYD